MPLLGVRSLCYAPKLPLIFRIKANNWTPAAFQCSVKMAFFAMVCLQLRKSDRTAWSFLVHIGPGLNLKKLSRNTGYKYRKVASTNASRLVTRPVFKHT